MTTTPFEWPFPIYLSGPMFSPGDLGEQRTIAAMLELNDEHTTGPILAPVPTSPPYTAATCYLPQRDGIEVGNVMALLNNPLIQSTLAAPAMAFVRKIVFALDMYQLLERCGAVVFNMDGRVPDDGSVVETSAAFVSARPIVIFKDTPVSMLGGADNPMITGLSTTWEYVTDFADIGPALIERIQAQGPSTFVAPPPVQAVIDKGRLVWEEMPLIRAVQAALPKVSAELEHLEQEALKELEEALKALIAWAKHHF